MKHLMLRLRWSWRDLRARWLQVAAIALVIGIGTGVYSGFSSMERWRYESYDASYEQLAMWDLHIALAEDTTLPATELLDAVSPVAAPQAVTAIEPRLVVQTQVDASTGDTTILVPGRIVGVETSDGGPHVATLHAVEGRVLTPDDAGNVAVLDEHFAAYHGLPPEGQLQVAGGVTLDYVGRGLSPEYFVIIPPGGTVFGEAGYAVMWAPLATAQQIAGRPGEANSLAVTLTADADPDAVETELVAALGSTFPDVGVTVTHQQDDPGVRRMYDDVASDQKINNVFSLLILGGAAFAAFNLTGRIIDAQRREIGIGMALGAPTSTIAARPLLVGAQVAALGVVFGMAVGYIIQGALGSLNESLIPLPVWITDFQPGVFARGALLGLVLPVAATVIPVIRSVRVPPVDAIRTTHRATSGGMAPLLRRVPLPGKSLGQLPFRNALRTPRRSLLTALGIATVIATLVAVIGMFDSIGATLDRGEDEILGDTPERMVIDVEVAPISSEPVQDLLASPLLDAAEPVLDIGGTLDPGGEQLAVSLLVTDLQSDLWHPTVDAGAAETSEPGVVIARRAATDLGLDVGDAVTLRHPFREGTGYRWVETELPVIGVHPHPFRFVAYVDIAHASLFNLDGLTNRIQAVPAAGYRVDDVERALFGQDGVVSARPVVAQVDAIRDLLDDFLAVFIVVEVAVLMLALLIAFNSASINVDERRRENATMFAFGVPVRSATRVNIVESLMIGLLGTVMGIMLGRLLLSWLTNSLVAESLPEVSLVTEVSTSTVLVALALGTVAVVAAPLLTIRKLRHMNIPATLRVVE